MADLISLPFYFRTENMIIGGFQKNSMIDFPGKISSVVFTGGCNFKCPYCHNPSLVDGSFETIPESSVFEYLKKRKGLIEGVVVTGGEPTLHKDLPFFCSRIKDLGFSVKLDTNGSKPDIIKKIVSTRSVDYIAMDVKAPLHNYYPDICKDKDVAEKIQSSIDVVIDSGIDYEFRVTCAKPFVHSTSSGGAPASR
jgi:pyruvate formate lyase activating enzyme